VGDGIRGESAPGHHIQRIGALWSPITLVDEAEAPPGFAAELARARAASHRRFEALVGDRYGRAPPLPSTCSEPSPEPPVSWEWAATPELFQPITLGPGQHPFPSPYAHQYRLMMIDPTVYLEAGSGRRSGRRRRDRRSAGSRPSPDIQGLGEDVVVNCTGLGARALFGDDTLVPIKGQLTVLVAQPDVSYALKSTVADLYMFPRRNGIVLGGSHQRGDCRSRPIRGRRAAILDQHRALFEVMMSRGDQ
jgi:hypothetical protein